MTFIIDDPRQWVEVKEERLRVRPWVVIVSGYARAECTTKREADNIRAAVINAFSKATAPEPGPDHGK